jgi:4-hydroxy-tetrahydrodipicolinate reductase
MGRAIVAVLAQGGAAQLVGATVRPGHTLSGRDAGEVAGAGRLGVPLVHDMDAALARARVWIDFTEPGAACAAAEHAAERGVGLVIGTTGLDATQRALLDQLARQVPIVLSANMSVGANVLAKLCEEAARALGPDYDPEIVEIHHRLKKDSPSGTALLLADAIADVTGRALEHDARHGRQGAVGVRGVRELGLHAVRGGDVVGDHTVHFLGLGERLELTHRAQGRETFARGAVRAAAWVATQKPGRYDMQDVLGLA